MIDNKFLPILSQNLLENLDDDKYYDITIEVGHKKIFRAHMFILNCRSSYLRRILSTNKKGIDETLPCIKLPNISPEIFQVILRYIYGGRLSLEEYDASDIIKILVAANELDLQELIPCLQSFLIENETNWMEQNFDLIYRISIEYNSFFELQKYCTELMSKEPDKIFKSLNFSSIPENLLVSIIQNDNLQMNEIQVWEHVLKWGLAQNPGLPSDPSSFSKDDFDTLRNTLQQCILFIKFFNLNSKEFFDKVFPYKRILSKELYKNLLKKFLDQDYGKIKESELHLNKEISIDSNIISNQHAEIISKWIDRLDITDKSTSSYKFKLLFRGSREGFASKKFHKICDHQSRTVTIIKVKGSSEILGGYNPIEWKSTKTYDNTKDSFIFSFKDKNDIENHILSRVKNKNFAIVNSPFFGPSFGINDLILQGGRFYKSSYCEKSFYNSYEKPIIMADFFSVEEYEVFQIIKN